MRVMSVRSPLKAMSKRTLEVAFGCYLFIVGSRFVMSLVGGQ